MSYGMENEQTLIISKCEIV